MGSKKLDRLILATIAMFVWAGVAVWVVGGLLGASVAVTQAVVLAGALVVAALSIALPGRARRR